MAKDFGGGISNDARRRMTSAIRSVRNAVAEMEKTIGKEQLIAERFKHKRVETPAVLAKIERVNGLITNQNGVLQGAIASFTKTVSNLKGDVTALAKSYPKLPKKP